MSGPGGVVLGIDTASPVIGAALWLGDRPGPEWSLRAGRGADEALLPAIAALIEGWGIERIAVSTGPGAFTGLRVGVAVALGLALSLELPVAAVDSLAARAALAEGERVLALLDARKGRVYAGLFRSLDGRVEALAPAVDAELAAVLPPAPFQAVGEGARVFAAAIEAAGGRILPSPERSPAMQVARLGLRLPASDPAAVSLQYLRAADAIVPARLGQRHGTPSNGDIHE
jgi:tRNA threonylcarbamoyladenosine biosynthesis protein TsaB